METKPKTRGERIAALRKARGFTQASLAGELGVTKAAVSKWEASASPDIGLDTFFRLAKTLEVDPQELATGTAAKTAKLDDIPQRRIDLLRMYGRLPDDVRGTIRALITTLAAAGSERYAAWSTDQAKRAAQRDGKPKKESV